jgi:hypothetical protein
MAHLLRKALTPDLQGILNEREELLVEARTQLAELRRGTDFVTDAAMAARASLVTTQARNKARGSQSRLKWW